MTGEVEDGSRASPECDVECAFVSEENMRGFTRTRGAVESKQRCIDMSTRASDVGTGGVGSLVDHESP